MGEYFENTPGTTEELTDRFVTLFCKAEKQAAEKGKPPKNRAISAINSADLYVMAPIIYFLNFTFKKYVPGFSSGENWNQQAKHYNVWRAIGLICRQFDISGWDRSLSEFIKRCLFDLYTVPEITDQIHHVPVDVYVQHATAAETRINADFREPNGKMERIGSALCKYQIFSGTADTKDGNTYCNSIISTYMAEVYFNCNILDNYDPELEDPWEHCEVRFKTNGDDNVTGYPPYFDDDYVTSVYKEVFCSPLIMESPILVETVQWGIGMTLKFLLQSPTDLIDFCSTTTFYCNGCGNHRITRKLDRFIQFTPWSAKGSELKTQVDIDEYKQQLYLSNLLWMDNLPIFRAFNNLLETKAISKHLNGGKPKELLPVPPADWDIEALKDYDQEEHNRFERLEAIFGRAQAFSMLGRQTTILPCCVESFYGVLETRYGWSRDDVDDIEADIYQAKYDNYIISPKLSDGLDRYESYIDQFKII